MTTPLEEVIRREIAERGPLTFRDFMEIALYHPVHGYYGSGALRTGRAGHFLTSPELDPYFGELWAQALRDLWERCARPHPFAIVEVGPGEGGLAEAILAKADLPLRYTLVEPTEAARRRQRSRLVGFDVTWTSSVEELAPGSVSMVIANEVLDNLPVHVVERGAAGLEEVYVDCGQAGLRETLGPPSVAELRSYGGELAEGERREVGLDARRFVPAAARRVGRGMVCFIDYGYQRWRGETLVAYSRGGPSTELLSAPGERDLTAHVDWSAVADALQRAGLEALGPIRQRDVLLALGASDADRKLKTAHAQALVAARGAEAVRALSRRQSLRALLDPGGLGGLQVMAGVRGIEPPEWLLSDGRLRRQDGSL